MFHQLCEEIFEDWKNHRLRLSPQVQQAFDLQFCPEPYLLFDNQTAPITFVTLNPGGGEPFQHRKNVGTARSPIRANTSYREAASDLGRWYALAFCPIKRAARTRIRAMLDLSSGLGRGGVEQGETMPFHSAKTANGSYLDGDPVLARYTKVLADYLAIRDVVCAMAGGLADGSGVRKMAEVIRLDWPGRAHLGLTARKGHSTSGLVFSKRGGLVRAVFYRQGGLGLPKREHLVRIRSALLSSRTGA